MHVKRRWALALIVGECNLDVEHILVRWYEFQWERERQLEINQGLVKLKVL